MVVTHGCGKEAKPKKNGWMDGWMVYLTSSLPNLLYTFFFFFFFLVSVALGLQTRTFSSILLLVVGLGAWCLLGDTYTHSFLLRYRLSFFFSKVGKGNYVRMGNLCNSIT